VRAPTDKAVWGQHPVSEASGARRGPLVEQTPPKEVARVPIPTAAGEFEVRAFEAPSGYVYLAMLRGHVGDGRSVLTRLHSECLTGDALGSRRCDCGVQLARSLRLIAAEGRGVLIYATGHEGRGIGIIQKLRAYMLQDMGSDTVSANAELGLPVDRRDYAEAVRILQQLGVRSVRILTNNPSKVEAMLVGGILVDGVVPLPVAAHLRNVRYLRTKEGRMGHLAPRGVEMEDEFAPLDEGPVDVTALLGTRQPPPGRPRVVLKYAQTLDGRIATASGDSRWISGAEERRLSHALRAASDSVLVGVGTVVADDPQLTVRMVPGASPARVVLDSTLRIPMTARVLDGPAWTVVLTTDRSDPAVRRKLERRGIAVPVVAPSSSGVDLPAALRVLRDMGLRSVLVEGGAGVITSMLAGGLADRVIVSVAPTLIGAGREAVGNLGVGRISQGVRLSEPSVHRVGRDLLVSGDLPRSANGAAAAAG
jgi:GTP cyclohydrolase II